MNRFLHQKKLGEGGFGEVYSALDQSLGIPVAVKYLHRQNPTTIYYFKKEFRTLAGISHPNLVTLHEFFHARDRWFFSMELVDGAPLVSSLRKDSPSPGMEWPVSTETLDPRAPKKLAPERAETQGALGATNLDRLRDTFTQLVQALQALHRAGMIHRDIKPSNVLCTASGRVVVLDFGLVIERSAQRSAGSFGLAGTPLYMSPERFFGETSSEASDWYSVGVMLYQALTGTLPWRDETEMMAQKLRGDGDGELPAASDVPEDLLALCAQLMSRRAAARPDGIEILRQLGRGAPPAAGPSAIRLPALHTTPVSHFVGRRAELAQLQTIFAGVAAGGAAMVRVEGESGIGKTVLCNRFVDELADRALVLRGRCYTQESLPYKALDGILDDLTRHLLRLPEAHVAGLLPRRVLELARLFPVLKRISAVASARRISADASDEVEIRRHAFVALRQLLERLAAEQPLILYIDDAQWGDLDSAQVLHQLLLLPDPPAVLVLLSHRGESPFVRELDRLGQDREARPPPHQVTLAPLPLDETRQLLQQLLPAHTQENAGLIEREAGGNPFLVEQLATFAGRSQAALAALPRADASLLDQMVGALVDPLPQAWQRLLAVVALAGHPIDMESARRAAGLETLDAVLLNKLRAEQLLTSQSSGGAEELVPYHERVRQAVVARVDQAARSQLHSAIADALPPSTPARLLAAHLREAGRLDEAADHTLRAAEQSSAALAFEDAAELYGQVLNLTRTDDPRRGELLQRHASALARCGRCIAAAPVYLQAAEHAERLVALDLRRRAFEQYYTGGMRDQAIALLRELLESVGLGGLADTAGGRLKLSWDLLRLSVRGTHFDERGTLSPEESFRIDLCYTASHTMLRRDSMLQTRCATRGLLLALEAGEPNRVAEGMAQVGAILTMIRPRAGGELVETGRRLAARQGEPRVLGVVELWSGMYELVRGAWTAALAAADNAVALFRECPGVTAEMQQAQILGLIVVQQLGRFDELERRAEEARAHAQSTGNHYLEDYTSIVLAIPSLMAGHVGAARERIGGALSRIPNGDSTRAGALVWVCACDLYEGKAAEAFERFHAARAELAAIQMSRHPMLRAASLIAELGVRLQLLAAQNRPAPAAVERDLKRLDRLAVPHAPGHAALLRAAVAASRGDRPAAAEACLRAAEAFDAAGLASMAMCSRRRLGEISGGEDGRREMAAADAWMRARGIADPERWTWCRAPGFAL